MNDFSHLINQDPIHILKQWVQEATQQSPSSNAMVLSTFDRGFMFFRQSHVSSRVVLLKKIEGESLIFYTNYDSPKSRAINKYNKVALNFYWPNLKRQIRIEGTVKKTPQAQSMAYWDTRPWESQLSQYISQQSSKLKNYLTLKEKWQAGQKKFSDGGLQNPIPCPKNWGGFACLPSRIEFWQEAPHRLHYRLLFTRKNATTKWKSYYLYP